MKSLVSWFSPIFGLTLFAVAAWVLWRELAGVSPREVADAIRFVPSMHLLGALLLSLGCYIVLTGYDAVALRYIGLRIRYREIAAAAFVGYALSNSIGFTPLTGGSVRVRFHRSHGLSAMQYVELVTMNTVTFWLGFTTLAGFLFLIAPPPLPADLQDTTLRPLGLALICLPTLFVVGRCLRKNPLCLRNHIINLPTPVILLSQIILGALELSCAAGILFLLLTHATSALSFPHFLGIFLLAHIIGLISQVPGGLGVFEALLLEFLAPFAEPAVIVGPLLLFRLLYNIIPLTIAACFLGLHEMRRKIALVPPTSL